MGNACTVGTYEMVEYIQQIGGQLQLLYKTHFHCGRPSVLRMQTLSEHNENDYYANMGNLQYFHFLPPMQ